MGAASGTALLFSALGLSPCGSPFPPLRHGDVGTQPGPTALPFPGLPGMTPTAKSPEAHGRGSVHPHPRRGSSRAGLSPGLSVQRSAAARGAASSDEGSAVPSSNRPDSSARAPRILQMGMEASGHPENPAPHSVLRAGESPVIAPPSMAASAGFLRERVHDGQEDGCPSA